MNFYWAVPKHSILCATVLIAIILSMLVTAIRAGLLPAGYAKQVHELMKAASEGSEDRKIGDYKWYQAVQVLGELRDCETAEKLASKVWIKSGPDGAALPLRPPDLSDYPAAIAMSRIDLPSVDPVLKEFVAGDKDTLVPALLLTAMMPTEAAVTSVDAFERQCKPHLNDAQRKRLNDLRDTIRAVVHNGRPLVPPIEKELAKHPLVMLRAKMIESNLTALQSHRDWSRLSSQASDCVAALGELRAAEAADFLGPRLLTKVSPQPAAGKERAPAGDAAEAATRPAAHDMLDSYPVAAAMANIGLPSVAPILKQVASGDAEDRTAEVACRVLARMMPRTVAAVFVDEAAGKEQNELAKQRLMKLKAMLLDEPASKPSTKPGLPANK